MRIVTTRVNNSATCLAAIRDAASGALLTGGTVNTAVLKKEFGDFSYANISGAAIVDPAVTTSPLWNPATEGAGGYNFISVIPGSMFAASGIYRASYKITSSSKTYTVSFEIRVASE